MDNNIELMRDMLMMLEDCQTSPRATVIIEIDELAAELGCIPESAEQNLDALLDLGYIDGPGRDEPGFWFFRKLTRKGIQFVQATRKPADWERMKRLFAVRDTASGS